MCDKEDYLTSYRVFFENFAANVNPEDQLPVQVAGYSITEEELLGEVLYWTTQYLAEKQCPQALMTPLRRIILDEVVTAARKQPEEFGFDVHNSVYIALRLMQAVTSHVNSVCLRYTDNARLDTLPAPGSVPEMRTVSAATKNRRRVMEDRHIEIGDLEALFGIETSEPTSFYAVYDGHAGSAAATYCAAHLHQYLVESPHFAKDLPCALREAFQRTDNDFVRKQNEKRACGGSTAVVVVIRGRMLHAAWAGDSQALLAKRMRLMQLVHPHKPSRQDERSRIEASGGTVLYWGIWRVNGQLAVSRAIGDAKYKPYVTARPEIVTVELDGDEDFVVVACDGLWDFVSEDQVALAVYHQLTIDPDDLKAVTKKLLLQAKRQNSTDNISVIVVFLKEPRAIAADNRSPMELGLENPLANAPPFAVDSESCKRPTEAGGGDADADSAETADNGVDGSDSDSEDLGPETAVDADDVDADLEPDGDEASGVERATRTPPTPLVHTVETVQQVETALVDNVAESGEESEDEWNYFKGEGEAEKEERELPSEGPDEPPRSDTPFQDNSAWESSSVDMNSSPLNPEAPVFVPGSVAGADVLLAESPRKPMPMDDIELPTDNAQFRTEAVVRPAELLDLDNSDQLNGHHNTSVVTDAKEQLNGNEKLNMESLGFGFNVGIESDKTKNPGLLQELERIQKDTMDFGDIQVFQTHTEVSPTSAEIDEELFERLKNKERDPMSMSFYQEKDDDTCEHFSTNQSQVDLNAVQPLPDSDDEDLMEGNGVCETIKFDKENIDPEHSLQPTDLRKDVQEPNNDMHLDDQINLLGEDISDLSQGDNFMDNFTTISSNIQTFANIDFDSGDTPRDATVMQTDTPESHKLLFEQIPEIPDGKSSELGFSSEDNLDPLEEEKIHGTFTPQEEHSQDIPQTQVKTYATGDLDNLAEKVKTPQVQFSEIQKLDHKQSSPSPVLFELENKSTTNEHTLPDNDDLIEKEFEKLIKAEFDAQVDAIIDYNGEVDNEVLYKKESEISSQLPEASAPNAFNEIFDSHLHKVDVHKQDIQNSDFMDVLQQKESVFHKELQECSASNPFNNPLDSNDLFKVDVHQQELLKSEINDITRLSPSTALQDGEATSPLPARSLQPASLPLASPLPSKSSLPSESPLPAGSPVPDEVPLPAESSIQADLRSIKTHFPSESPLRNESVPQSRLSAENISDSPVPLISDSSSTFEKTQIDQICESRLMPVVSDASETAPVTNSELIGAIDNQVTEEVATTVEPLPEPTPDLVPDKTGVTFATNAFEMPSQPITDVDIGIPESRAQEICVPVTNEIHQDDVMLESNMETATPPPTPAVELSAPPLDNLVPKAEPIAAMSETPTAVDLHTSATDESKVDLTAIATGAAAAVAATAAVATTVGVTKAKATTTKKLSTTPKTTALSTKTTTKQMTTPRTPVSLGKKTPSSTPVTKTPSSTPATKTPNSTTTKTIPATKTPSSTLKTSTSAPATPKPSTQKVSATLKSTTAKPSLTILKDTATAAKTTAATKPAPISKTTPKPPASKSVPALARTAPAASRPLVSRPATTSATRLTSSASARPKDATTAPKTDRKPLTNGDVKPIAKKIPTSTVPAARPATKPATPAMRPTPRPAPRSAPPTTAAAAATKTSGPKPTPRPAPRPALDKQSKDLANKRITAKAAPPRTAPTKQACPPKKPAPIKGPIKKPPSDVRKEGESGALTNGSREPELVKPPPSPPAADNALLPDVIA